MKIGITGAAGNLGGMLAEYLLNSSNHHLNLFVHNRLVSNKLQNSDRITIFKGDLARKNSINEFSKSSDVIIHFAGVLFKAKPANFLPTTNTQYFENLCETAVDQDVKRIILVSFPHVEGETTPGNPAMGELDMKPISIHATTRLEEERYLFMRLKSSDIETVSLRLGMVYGKGVLMIDAARWIARYDLLGVWKKPTYIHLISKEDFLESTKNAIVKQGISGIYHIGDEGVQTLQEFLKIATSIWGYKEPWNMPDWLINLAASLFEMQSIVFGTPSPLTRDFIKIGKVSYYGDTSRMYQDLLSSLKYKTIKEGKINLK